MSGKWDSNCKMPGIKIRDASPPSSPQTKSVNVTYQTWVMTLIIHWVTGSAQKMISSFLVSYLLVFWKKKLFLVSPTCHWTGRRQTKWIWVRVWVWAWAWPTNAHFIVFATLGKKGIILAFSPLWQYSASRNLRQEYPGLLPSRCQ